MPKFPRSDKDIIREYEKYIDAEDAADDDANDELVASEIQRMEQAEVEAEDAADDDANDELVASEIQRMEQAEA